MNTERLHAIARAVIDDINTTNSEATLQQVVESLQNQVNQPQDPAFQNQLSQSLTTIYEALENSLSNSFSPAWKQALGELGLEGYLGTTLKIRIKEIFERNQITQAVALQELNEINNQLKQKKSSLDQLLSVFEILEIGSGELEPGQYEVGILIPRLAVSNNLKEFSKDLERIEKTFGVFSELTTNSRPGFKINSVSSSDFIILLAMIPATVASIAFAVERLLTVYKRILEIRIKYSELKKLGFENKELTSIKKKADSAIMEEIDKLAPELLEKYYHNEDENRKHELSTELTKALVEFAKRIDKGYNVEIRIPKEKDSSDEAEATHRETITAALKNLEFMQLGGEPVLSLLEPTDEEDTEEKE